MYGYARDPVPVAVVSEVEHNALMLPEEIVLQQFRIGIYQASAQLLTADRESLDLFAQIVAEPVIEAVLYVQMAGRELRENAIASKASVQDRKPLIPVRK